MKAFEKWPEFMRAGSQPSAPQAARQEEGELELDTSTDVRPRGRPQARKGGRVQRAQGRTPQNAGRGRRLFSMFLAGASVGVIGVGVFFGYFWFTGGGGQSEVPVIQAVDDPVKVKPENPGGLEVPYQDRLVLNQPESGNAASGTVERLLPPPESPKPIVDTTAAAPAPAASSAPAAVASIVVPPSPEQQAATTVTNGSVPQTPEIQTDTPAVVAAAPTAPAAQTGQNGQNEISPSTGSTLGVTNVQAALPKPAATPAAPAKGSYLLQLGSFNSREVGQGAWDGFQKKHPDLLAGMSLFLQEAEVNGKTYHRVQAGPFPNRATAIDLCAELKSRSQDCLVVKR